MSDYEQFNSERYTYEGESTPVTAPSNQKPSSIWQDDEFRPHLTTYVTIIGVLFLIDFLTGVGLKWFMYPAICWGIGLSIHFWVSLFELRIHTPIKRDLYIHASVEGTLIAFFFLMDLFSSPRLSWWIYPSLPLAFAWFCHLGAYLFRVPQGNEEEKGDWDSRYNQLVIKEKFRLAKEDNPRVRYLARQIVILKMSIGVHLVVFLAAAGFFFTIDALTGGRLNWWYWPVLPWLIGVLEHIFGANHQIQRLRGKRVNKYYNLVYPGAACFFFFAIDALTGVGLTWWYWPTLPVMAIALFVVTVVPQPKAEPVLKPIDRYLKRTATPSHSGIEVEVTFENLSEEEDQPVPIKKTKRRFCAKCGAPVADQFKFCEYCGAKVRES